MAKTPWTSGNWCKKLGIQYDYNYLLSDFVGKEGISSARISAMDARCRKIVSGIAAKRKAGKLPFMDLPYQKGIAAIQNYARKIAPRTDAFVVLGIGGSALGTTALLTSLKPLFYNELPPRLRKTPRLYVSDNPDPDFVLDMLRVLDPAKTVFNIVTKSGTTAETMAVYLVVRDLLNRKLGSREACKHIVFTTDPKKGVLRELANKEGIEAFEVPEGVGGRFSVLTSVGLLPAAVSGIDIAELLAGAATMEKICRNPNPRRNPAVMNALLHYLHDTEKGHNIHVMMPYSNHLRDIADWHRQLWAESLGKKWSLDGKVVHTGPTPVKALGTTDQHSQVQLYMEGPLDKVTTFIGTKRYNNACKIPRLYPASDELGYLGGKDMSALIGSELLATEYALKSENRPSCKILLPEIRPFTIGQILFMLELQTVVAGGLYNIDPLDQPGVEAGKIATYALMGRKRFEQDRLRLQKGMRKLPRYVIG